MPISTVIWRENYLHNNLAKELVLYMTYPSLTKALTTKIIPYVGIISLYLWPPIPKYGGQLLMFVVDGDGHVPASFELNLVALMHELDIF
jgi:hypothetical protein